MLKNIFNELKTCLRLYSLAWSIWCIVYWNRFSSLLENPILRVSEKYINYFFSSAPAFVGADYLYKLTYLS